MNRELWRVATHECGHAIAALEAGRAVTELAATSTKGGHCLFDERNLHPIDDLLISDAALAAEEHFIGAYSLTASAEDRRRSEDAAFRAACGGHSRQAICHYLNAQDFVGKHASRIEWLAKQLAHSGKLTGGDLAGYAHSSTPLAKYSNLYHKPMALSPKKAKPDRLVSLERAFDKFLSGVKPASPFQTLDAGDGFFAVSAGNSGIFGGSSPARGQRESLRGATPEEDKAIAFHEAGHAVAAHFCGSKVVGVTIEDGYSLQHGTRFQGRMTQTNYPSDTQTDVHDYIITAAGEMAEHKYRTGNTRGWAPKSYGTDGPHLEALKKKHSNNPGFALDAERQCAWLLSEHWANVARVAGSLLSSIRLTGKQVRELCFA